MYAIALGEVEDVVDGCGEAWGTGGTCAAEAGAEGGRVQRDHGAEAGLGVVAEDHLLVSGARTASRSPVAVEVVPFVARAVVGIPEGPGSVEEAHARTIEEPGAEETRRIGHAGTEQNHGVRRSAG